MTVHITGVGVLCAHGIGANLVFDRFVSGVRPAQSRIPEFDPKVLIGEKGVRHFDRTALLLCSAASLALAETDLLSGAYPPEAIGTIVGITHGSVQAIADFDRESLREGPRYVNPQKFGNTVINAPAGRLAIRFGLTGLNATFSSGSTSFVEALDYAAALIEAHQLKAALVGSAVGHSDEVADGYRQAGRVGSEPSAPLPFADEVQLPALGEAGVVLVLEEEGIARGRGVSGLARVSGAASALVEPSDPAAIADVMRQALEAAGVEPGAVGAVVADASGCSRSDSHEARALAQLFRGRSTPLVVTAPKAASGECLEASAALGAALAVFCIDRGLLPPVAGLDRSRALGPDLELVGGSARPLRPDHILVHACDGSGHVAAVVLSRP